jgi:hypothetical protein
MVNTPKAWVVVCTDLHIAAGIYTDIRVAIELCKQMNEQSNCTFKPVECMMGDNVEYIKVDVPDTPEGLGGYL